MKPRSTATSSLLYWLLIVCGLVGLTLQRLDALGEVAPLWLGTVAGVALGQFVAWLRVRSWVLAVVGAMAMWISPLFLFVLYEPIRGPVETCAFAFVPAALCGYLSLSERGGLLAFWYPAVLWMLVILDGSGDSALSSRASIPFVIGLAALFVAFLRARETRRAAIWQGHAHERLAEPAARVVLRTSPLRAASQHAFTGLAGAAALVLAAWVAPQLWQQDTTRSAHGAPGALAYGAHGARGAHAGTLDEPPCCNAPTEERSMRVREYLPLLHGHASDLPEASPFACTVCSADTSSTASGSNDPDWDGTYTPGSPGYEGRAGYTGGIHGGGGSVATSSGYSPAGYGGADPGYVGPSPWELAPHTGVPSPTPQELPTPPAVLEPIGTPQGALAPLPVAGATPTVPTKAAPGGPSHGAQPGAAQPAVTEHGAAMPTANVTPPWKSMLALVLGAMGAHLLLRALRRALTLRHLARPFWPERLDQRISNHWQRLLIGLRDAGIHDSEDEQPHALARRVGIEGLEKCATILERVRHGVRVDAGDLDEMDAAAGQVYRAARKKAGLAGRTAAWVRSPL